MPTKIKEAQPPRGVMRELYRLPIHLFHWHMGWLMTDRFLMITHIGRKSGLKRQAVIEVLQHDRASDTWYLLAGFGEKTDWLRNIEHTPQIVITVGRRQFDARAERVSPEEAEEIILNYARRNPLAIKVLPRLMGYQLDGSDEDFRALAHSGIVVAFHPIKTGKGEV